MVRFNTEWRASWQGHTIIVRNWWNLLLFTGEELWVDGKLRDKHTGILRLSSTLVGTCEANGEVFVVRAYVFPLDAVRVGCYIFVNDEQVGGDLRIKL